MRKIIPISLLLLFPITAFGNVVWPALVTEAKVNSIPIITLSLLIEYLTIRWLFKADIKKCIYYTVCANLSSGILGLFLRPLSGLASDVYIEPVAMYFNYWGTFNPIAWFFVPIIGGAINAALELLTIRLIWKEKFSAKNYLSLWGVNWATVGLATVWVIISPPQM